MYFIHMATPLFFECAARYALEYFDNYHETISLAIYITMLSISVDKVVSIAPNKLLLKIFGGNMDIEESL